MIPDETLIILIATNVSEQKGGEAMKALQIFREIRKAHPNTLQITHERNESELSARTDLGQIQYVRDTFVSIFLWRTRVLRFFLDFWFLRRAVAAADRIAEAHDSQAVVHQTEPNSPVTPRALSRRHPNVLGPINGNIYYPRAFRKYEGRFARLRRRLHAPIQMLNSALLTAPTRADLILYAGGERTHRSLTLRGCRESQLLATLDCGVPAVILDRPRIRHRGRNARFVHFGRLVLHKCTFLIIESLSRTRPDVCLDVVGTGPELEHCKQLTASLRLESRVRFLGWYGNHEDLIDSLGQYRGVAFPSIEDANGIVIQEAMALGLPPVCLDWGGPQLLVEHGVSGYLIEPVDEKYIVAEMARHLDRLAEDGELAEAMSIAARTRAQSWRWPRLVDTWLAAYPLRGSTATGARAGTWSALS